MTVPSANLTEICISPCGSLSSVFHSPPYNLIADSPIYEARPNKISPRFFESSPVSELCSSKNLSISVRIPKTRGQAEPQTYGAKKVYKAVFGETAASLTTFLFKRIIMFLLTTIIFLKNHPKSFLENPHIIHSKSIL